MANTIKSINLDLIIEGVGNMPTVPVNKHAVFGDSDFDDSINLMIGQKAYNVTDDIWYYRSKTGIKILPAITGAYKLTIYDPTGTYIMHGLPSGYYNAGDKIYLPDLFSDDMYYTIWLDENGREPSYITYFDDMHSNTQILTMPAQNVTLQPRFYNSPA